MARSATSPGGAGYAGAGSQRPGSTWQHRPHLAPSPDDSPPYSRAQEDTPPVDPRLPWSDRQAPEAPPPWLAALLRLIPPTATVPAAPPTAAQTDAAPAPADAAPAPADAAPAPADAAPPEPAAAAGELVPWLDDALRGELGAAPALSHDLRDALERWNLATGVNGALTFSQLLERWRPAHAPEIPTTLLVAFSKYEASGWDDHTHGTRANGYTSPPFYELGVFQVPAGLHGPCTDTGCGLLPPGVERPGQPSAWSRICKRLSLDPNKWTDRTTQVRVGLCNLEDDARVIRKRYPELFAQPGSDWDLRAAVLLPFVGIGFANTLLKKYRQELAKLPESRRWSFLSQQAIAADPNNAHRVRDLLGNVEKKMKLHGALKAHFARNSATPGS